MNCPFETCINHNNCFFLDLLKKIPKSMDACSYSKTSAQAEKLNNKKKPKLDHKEIRTAKRAAKKSKKEIED